MGVSPPAVVARKIARSPSSAQRSVTVYHHLEALANERQAELRRQADHHRLLRAAAGQDAWAPRRERRRRAWPRRPREVRAARQPA